MARLYANENFPRAAVEKLRDLGHDVLTTFDAHQAGKAIPDRDVLTYATSENRAVITFNRRDFIRLHQELPNHSGVVGCTVDSDTEALSERIHILLRDLESFRQSLYA